MLRALPLILVTAAAPTLASAEPLEAPALVRSKSRIDLRSSLSVPVASVPLRDGARFAKGDLLVAFDCSTLSAERRAAKAAESLATMEVRAKTRLLAHGAVGRDEVARAKAQKSKAAADRAAIAARMKSCRIAAPFDGRVVHVSVRRSQLPAPGTSVMTIIDDRRLDVEIVAPSRWLAWVETGQGFRIAIEETGRTVSATVTAIGSEVDPVSRTVRLFGALEDGARILPGMSGTARFEARR